MVAIKKPADDVLFAGFIANRLHDELTVFQLFCVENQDDAILRTRVIFEAKDPFVLHQRDGGIVEIVHRKSEWFVFLVPLGLDSAAFDSWVSSFENVKFIIESAYMIPRYLTPDAFIRFISHVKWVDSFQSRLMTFNEVSILQHELENA